MSKGRRLRVGVQLPEVEWVVRWPQLKAMALDAEAVGFDSLWLGDHLLYKNPGQPSRGPWEVWSTMAAIAAVTETITLGPLVAATSFHAPTMLAKKAAALHEISQGRFVLGLGAGWNETEYRAFGFPFDHRISRFEEAFTIIRQLLAGKELSFEGTYYHFEGCEILPASHAPGPPLMIGSSGPRMLSITLPYVQSWNAWFASFGNTVGGCATLLESLRSACERAGTDYEALQKTVAVLVQAPGGTGRAAGDDGKEAPTPIMGNPNAVAECLSAYADIGIDEVQLVLDPITQASINWCGDVLSALRQ